VTTIQPGWEKAFFFLGQYWDTLVTECRRQHHEMVDRPPFQLALQSVH
jgi:hypothetical protein